MSEKGLVGRVNFGYYSAGGERPETKEVYIDISLSDHYWTYIPLLDESLTEVVSCSKLCELPLQKMQDYKRPVSVAFANLHLCHAS